jgi:hypothetical protein
MEWTVGHLEEHNIVFVKILSPADMEGTREFVLEANSLAREHNTHRYLVDHRGVDVVMSVLDIDKIPGLLEELNADLGGKTAILMDSSAPKKNLFNFLKNVFHLLPMRFEVFSDEDEAIAWLKSD